MYKYLLKSMIINNCAHTNIYRIICMCTAHKRVKILLTFCATNLLVNLCNARFIFFFCWKCKYSANTPVFLDFFFVVDANSRSYAFSLSRRENIVEGIQQWRKIKVLFHNNRFIWAWLQSCRLCFLGLGVSCQMNLRDSFMYQTSKQML